MSKKMFNMDTNMFTGEKQPIEMVTTNPEAKFKTIVSKKERKQQRQKERNNERKGINKESKREK